MTLAKNILITLFFALCVCSNAHAVRWFEVELIAFKQNNNPELNEDFSVETNKIEGKKQLDLLTKGFNDMGQQQCLQGNEQFDPRDITEKITGLGTSWVCDDNTDYLNNYHTLPIIPYAELQEHMDSIYLLNEAQFKFQAIVKKLRRRGLKPILHTGWRFPEQSKRAAPFMKIFAGKKSSEQLSYLADDQEDSNFISLVPKVTTRKKAQPDSNLWQLEGLIKIHVNHYLYVTSELDILFDTEDNKTQTARLSQFTRVYSGDIHYLDNPKLGVIFQIRKYQH